jgi:hypothetical protein
MAAIDKLWRSARIADIDRRSLTPAHDPVRQLGLVSPQAESAASICQVRSTASVGI